MSSNYRKNRTTERDSIEKYKKKKWVLIDKKNNKDLIKNTQNLWKTWNLIKPK